jgi:hypothetical protein
VKNTQFLWYQALEAAKDIKMYCFAALALGREFLQRHHSRFRLRKSQSLPISTPHRCLLVHSHSCRRNFRLLRPKYTLCDDHSWFIVGVAGMIGIATISTEHPLALLACTWLQGVWGVSNILSWTLVAVNVAGHTKPTTANAV